LAVGNCGIHEPRLSRLVLTHGAVEEDDGERGLVVHELEVIAVLVRLMRVEGLGSL